MGFLLKEALKCLCAENQWSYAVFWKIGCRNPMLLVWEECHYEPAQCSSLTVPSAIESSEMLHKEWEGHSNSPESQLSQFGCQVEDRVCSLINKMMMNSQVHVVGEGIVGRAAFTGTHLWILRESCIGDGHPSEVLAEVNHQILGGMQTIAVIPVLPHGVVQLASPLAIMENMEFVNNVKGLFAHLGSVPGTLIANNYVRELGQKIGVPISLGIPNSAGQAISKMEKLAPLVSDSCNQQTPTSQASRFVGQLSHSLNTQNLDSMQSNAPTMVGSLSDFFQENSLPMMKPNPSLSGQQEAGSVGSQVICSNSGGCSNQQYSPYNPVSRFSHQPIGGQSGVTSSGLPFMAQQILSDDGLQEPFNNSLPASNSTITQLRTIETAFPSSLKESGIASLLGGSELPNAGSSFQTLTSVPCSYSIPCRSTDSNSSCSTLDGIGLQFTNLPNTTFVFLPNHSNHSNISDMLPGGSDQSHPSTNEKRAQTEFPAEQQRIGEDLFQSLNILSHWDEHVSRDGSMPGVLQDCLVGNQKHKRGTSPSPKHVVCEDAHVRPPSGEDLFDILGPCFTPKQLCGSWNDFLMHESDASVQSLGTDVSTCITQMDTGLDYATNAGISECGIFSGTGADHLLDAVVSKVHSASKQNSDNDVSCRTTLTKISSSSVPTESPKYSRVAVSHQMKVDLPPPPSKSEMVGSCSFRSGCSRDNAGGSQINPIYTSQMNLWAEDGQNMKPENSISTAHSKRSKEMGRPNRKRLRPGENPRPRPKDRQMIQDRVKELREIVPNGAKCSIDALLERAIKHMLFLQSVTKHADKIKQTGNSQIISKEGGLLLKDNFEGGATWAYEVGSQSMNCPLIVEDLNLPHQMLVEMLCEERGFFLEIADMIRGLGLTILKGVMEAQNDKVWARFAVEANRDVTRMQIFLSLVHLLKQAGKSCSLAPQGIDNSNLLEHNTFHLASIPATGGCNHLQ